MACAACGVNDGDGHLSDCEWVKGIFRDIQLGKAKIISVKHSFKSASQLPLTLEIDPVEVPDIRQPWQKTHGTDADGKFANHAPELRDWR